MNDMQLEVTPSLTSSNFLSSYQHDGSANVGGDNSTGIT